MFLKNQFINENNISTINFFEHNSKRIFVVKRYYSNSVEEYLVSDVDIGNYKKLSSPNNIDEIYGIDESSINDKMLKAQKVAQYKNLFGGIEVNIIMNNGNTISCMIKKWEKIHSFNIHTKEIEVISNIKKEYSDNLGIEEVYSILKKSDKRVDFACR